MGQGLVAVVLGLMSDSSVFSGNQPTVLETAEAFHPEKKKWEALPPMPTPRCACSSVVFKNCLLAVGGVSQGLSDAVEALYVSDS